jgi:DNA gyrase subunit A
MICIGADDLRIIGRNTQGVRLVNLRDGDKMVSAAILEPEEDLPETDSTEIDAPAEGETESAEPAAEEDDVEQSG